MVVNHEIIPLLGGRVSITDEIDFGTSPGKLLYQIMSETSWSQEHFNFSGRVVPFPRLTAWYGDPGAAYTYSGIKNNPLPWTPLLTFLKETIERATGGSFNSVLLNLYRDGNDSIGFHSDDEPELGSYPFIASLSLGETRTLTFKHKFNKQIKPINVDLTSGSVLVMSDETQLNWSHGIKKDNSTSPRVNLTFRKILV